MITDDHVTAAQDTLKEVLTVAPADSKKYILTIVGLKLISACFVITAGCVMFKPEVASSLTQLASLVLGAIGVMTSVYVGGQSFSEAKASTAMAQTVTSTA